MKSLKQHINESFMGKVRDKFKSITNNSIDPESLTKIEEKINKYIKDIKKNEYKVNGDLSVTLLPSKKTFTIMDLGNESEPGFDVRFKCSSIRIMGDKLNNLSWIKSDINKLVLLSCNSLTNLSSLSTNINHLSIRSCNNLKMLNFNNISKSIEIEECKKMVEFGTNITNNLDHIIIRECDKLTNLSGLPKTCNILTIDDCKSLTTLQSSLNKVKQGYTIIDCENVKSCKGMPDNVEYYFIINTGITDLVGSAKNVEFISVAGNKNLKSLNGITQNNLEWVSVAGCDKLTEIGTTVNTNSIGLKGSHNLLIKPGELNVTKLVDCGNELVEYNDGFDYDSISDYNLYSTNDLKKLTGAKEVTNSNSY